jgi:hypothetical protein
MAKLRHFVMLAVVIACGVGTIFSVDRNYRPIARIDPSQEQTKSAGLPQESIVPAEPLESAGSPREPIVPAEPLDDVRKAERSRRAIRPAGDPKRKDGLNYKGVLKGWEGGTSLPKPAEPMPPTYCRSIERAPKNTDWATGPYYVHDRTVDLFENESGFGNTRMFRFKNDRGVFVVSRDIDRVELVSLLTDDEPSVYVLDEMATPPLARQAKRRPLDEFERLGLDAVRCGEELVWTREAPTRMFGAIRAKADCLHCHANAKEGDLLGAFTYYLMVPVDRLNIRE